MTATERQLITAAIEATDSGDRAPAARLTRAACRTAKGPTLEATSAAANLLEDTPGQPRKTDPGTPDANALLQARTCLNTALANAPQ
jgi:prophage DNA circulation protein